ncbi:MAG: energy-coupling factor ABC transporter ATP-binding protein [Desulfovibrio sp.]|jgi:cobalt/nickel transport system ATP-binding protein|nr:energy-coupling factor ABC transporter ATP-binding protein [Desulfovibrio sp.]
MTGRKGAGAAAPLFAVEDLHFTYRGKSDPLFTGANLRLGQGERIGICGKNGSGKSTLLHIGAGLLLPQQGKVILAGQECAGEKDFVEARKSLGYLLQNATDMLFCASILEDVAFGPCNQGLTAGEAEKKARDTLGLLGLSSLSESNGQLLSGGEQRLAALASILAMGVEVLFLDEPTNDLDAQGRDLLILALERFAVPALIVSHDDRFLRRVCNRFCLLADGLIKETDGPA